MNNDIKKEEEFIKFLKVVDNIPKLEAEQENTHRKIKNHISYINDLQTRIEKEQNDCLHNYKEYEKNKKILEAKKSWVNQYGLEKYNLDYIQLIKHRREFIKTHEKTLDELKEKEEAYENNLYWFSQRFPKSICSKSLNNCDAHRVNSCFFQSESNQDLFQSQMHNQRKLDTNLSFEKVKEMFVDLPEIIIPKFRKEQEASPLKSLFDF